MVYVIKIGRHYLAWDTVWDAPCSKGMTKTQLGRWMGVPKNGHTEYHGGVDKMVVRVQRNGTSAYTVVRGRVISDGVGPLREDLLGNNRAGLRETRLTEKEIRDYYCLGIGRKPTGKPLAPSKTDIVRRKGGTTAVRLSPKVSR
jgi:hypothetical protein